MEDTVFAANVRAALALLRERRLPAVPWVDGENLPWDEPAFSQRMLREHLDQTHDAASRPVDEILVHVDGLERELNLSPGDRNLDVTCGPGLYDHELARRGYRVTGVDFAPAAIGYARERAAEEGLDCTFVQQDVRQMGFREEFEAAILLFGQLNAFNKGDAAGLLRRVARALVPGGRFVAEVHNMGYMDREEYTDLIKAGIIDPTKVVRFALQNAASVASLLITTEAMVAEKPEKKAEMPPMPPGGMGGMY